MNPDQNPIEKINLNKLMEKDPESKNVKTTGLLKFTGIPEGYNVYNITPPSTFEDKEILFGRVENEKDENAEAWMFIKNKDDVWESTDVRVSNLQDPFYTVINDEIVFGGVRVGGHPFTNHGPNDYYTVFWRIKRWEDLPNTQPFAIGPEGQKDIRLVELKDGIGVFTRPQGEIGGRGVVAFIKINSLDDLCMESIEAAEPIEDLEQLLDKRRVWGGVNEVHKLKNDDKVGVIGHVAYRTDLDGNIIDHNEGIRHYHGFTFVFDTNTKKVSKPELIIKRHHIPSSKVKVLPDKHEDDLKDVVFTGGGRYDESNKSLKLYGGVSDADAFYAEVDYPFE